MPRYIHLAVGLSLEGPIQDWLKRLTPGQAQAVSAGLKVQVQSTGLDFIIKIPDHVSLLRKIPITADLTDLGFTECFEEFGKEVVFFRDRVSIALDHVMQKQLPGTTAANAEKKGVDEGEIPPN